MSMRSIRVAVGRRSLTFLVGGLLFLSLDFGAKSLDRWLRPPPAPQTHLSIRVAHPEYDHGIRPNAVGTESYGSQRAEYFSNSLGLRDEKIRDVPLCSNVPRFLFMGDSMTEAGPVSWNQTFVGRLQDRWHGRAEVLNGAVADFGPVLILPKLKDLLDEKGLQVDQVVIVLNPSVLRTSFTYVPSQGGKIEHHPYGPYHGQASFFARTDKLESWLEANVEKKFVLLGALVRNARLSYRRIHPLTRSMDRFKSWVEQGFSADPEEQRLILEGTRRTLESLDQIHEFLASKKVALGVVFLPWPKTLASLNPPPLPERLDTWAKERGVTYLNLLPLFLSEGSPEEVVARYYLKNDNHLTEAGHERVATWLADPRNGLFPVRRQIPPK